MHHLPGEPEGPIRATRHQSRLAESLTMRVNGEPTKETLSDGTEREVPSQDFQEYIIPNRDLRESDWGNYPAVVRKAIREVGLWTVKTDAEMKDAAAPAPDAEHADIAVEEAPAPPAGPSSGRTGRSRTDTAEGESK